MYAEREEKREKGIMDADQQKEREKGRNIDM